MLLVYGQCKYVYSYSAGIDGDRRESDVCRRQILTSKVDPRIEKVKNDLVKPWPGE